MCLQPLSPGGAYFFFLNEVADHLTCRARLFASSSSLGGEGVGGEGLRRGMKEWLPRLGRVCVLSGCLVLKSFKNTKINAVVFLLLE